MAAPLALTLLFSLLVSIVVAMALVPVLCDVVLKQVAEREFGLVRRFRSGYETLLGQALTGSVPSTLPH